MQLKECVFHPYEIAFCGFSNSGKSTLISSILKEIHNHYKIGYIKSDAHSFEMDKKEKDTSKAYANGAQKVFISDPTHYASINRGEPSNFDLKNQFIDCDFVIVEGHKRSNVPKFVFIGEGEKKLKTIEKFNNNEFKNVLAFIGNSGEDSFSNELPFFTRNQVSEITNFFLNRFYKIYNNSPIYGLILTGGKSSRMGKDKGSLKYHGKSQIQYGHDLLEEHCDKVFISCRKEQTKLPHLVKFNQIYDSFPSIGPSSGILSAMFEHPEATWIIIACDLPYLDSSTIDNLIKNRNPFKTATCYLNPKRSWPEPLCTIYEIKSRVKLMQFFAQGRPCPRKVLFNTEIKALELLNKDALNNANTPNDYDLAIKHFKNGELNAH